MKFSALSIFLMVCSIVSAQGVAKINDPHIVAQEDRMVYKEWGNFQPKPKYFLGVQTKYSYTATWGILAPKKSRRYRKGDDIRPLSETGQQTIRQEAIRLQGNQTEIMEKDAIVMGGDAEDEFYYNSSVNYAVDPLFILYYNKKLKPVREWEAQDFLIHVRDLMINDPHFKSFGLSDQQINSILAKTIESQMMTIHMNEMDILLEQYEMTISTPMPRGKRLIAYHDIFIKYRSKYTAYVNALMTLSRIRANIEAYDRSRDIAGDNKEVKYFSNNEPFDDLAIFYKMATKFRLEL